MCKVLVKDPRKNLSFVMYNHIYGRSEGVFTIEELLNELKQYNLELTRDEIQDEIKTLIKDGVVTRNYKSYTRALMA